MNPKKTATADTTFELGNILGPKATAALQTITIHPACAGCGTPVDALQSLCASCTADLMRQPPSWTDPLR